MSIDDQINKMVSDYASSKKGVQELQKHVSKVNKKRDGKNVKSNATVNEKWAQHIATKLIWMAEDKFPGDSLNSLKQKMSIIGEEKRVNEKGDIELVIHVGYDDDKDLFRESFTSYKYAIAGGGTPYTGTHISNILKLWNNGVGAERDWKINKTAGVWVGHESIDDDHANEVQISFGPHTGEKGVYIRNKYVWTEMHFLQDAMSDFIALYGAHPGGGFDYIKVDLGEEYK